jgi:CelD/BcsL family acetyltransferase involved in cellulose biosynthesis
MAYDGELLTRIEDLAALSSAWESLARRARGATIFQTPAWVLPWWTQLGEGNLASPVVRSGGELVGLAAAYVRRDGEGALVGTGNTDYVDAVCDARHAAGAARAIIHQLTRVACTRWVLQPLDESSPLMAAGARDCLMQLSPFDVYPRLSLPSTIEQLERAIPHHQLAKLRRARHALEGRGDVTFVSADRHTVGPMLDVVRRLHAKRWERRGAPGVLADARVRAFHEAVVRNAFELGALRLYEMRLNGAAVAGFYGFSWNGRTLYYIGGYDPAYSKFSVGSLVILHAIENAVRGGDTTFDFLRGGEAYKYAWGAQPAVGVTLQLRPAERWSGAA